MKHAATQFGTRRRLLQATGGLAVAAMGWSQSGLLRAADLAAIPIADAHSHIGLISSNLPKQSLKDQMLASGVMLLSWNIVGDSRWIRRVSGGIQQRGTPSGGDQVRYFRQRLGEMRTYLAANGLPYVRQASDIDAARSGTPMVVIAVEGAGFAEDGLDGLAQSHADGLRHLQLVHYVYNHIGDFQTESPKHNGMTEFGINVVRECNRLGILVDLAHATNPVIDKALEVSTAPVIWSHSAITDTQYNWRQPQARRLHVAYARKVAQRGGAVGLWSLKSSMFSSLEGYADELMRMADAIGPEHVMFGTDLDGVGTNGMMGDLPDLRRVADLLQKRGVDDKALRAICFENYARCLRESMVAAKT